MRWHLLVCSCIGSNIRNLRQWCICLGGNLRQDLLEGTLHMKMTCWNTCRILNIWAGELSNSKYCTYMGPVFYSIQNQSNHWHFPRSWMRKSEWSVVQVRSLHFYVNGEFFYFLLLLEQRLLNAKITIGGNAWTMSS